MKKRTLNTTARVTTNSPQGQQAVNVFCQQYNKAGLTSKDAQYLNENPAFVRYLAKGIQIYSAAPDPYRFARLILGNDFLTPEEVMGACKGIVYTKEQITALAKRLPSKKILRWCKQHKWVLMPNPPTRLSLLEIRKLDPSVFYSKSGGWYATERFADADKTPSVGWILAPKTPVAGSVNKTWDEQSKLLSALEHVPNAAEMVWVITTYSRVHGIKLFERASVRTLSLKKSMHITVGHFPSGIEINYQGNDRDQTIGVIFIQRS